MKWTAADIPDQSGRVVVVTGANSGLGAVVATELALAGADVVLAGRDTAKSEAVARTIKARDATARTAVERLDLGDLASVRDFAARVAEARAGIDLLVNNAGVMAPPRRLTADGFESQFGTNHLGHFALTALLMPSLLKGEAPRVVTVTSQAHQTGEINFDDLHGESKYNRWAAYSQSKLADLLFAFELDRRARAANLPLRSLAAHPGYAATNLQTAGPSNPADRLVMAIGNRLIAQSAEMGALPILFAATGPDVAGGEFFGPDGFMEGRGHPTRVQGSKKAQDPDRARRLWEVSEELTGVEFDLAKPAGP
jgi:NAD(P)-dependent dehydrogenase (short-subunit alcohol dehydrogenase family)